MNFHERVRHFGGYTELQMTFRSTSLGKKDGRESRETSASLRGKTGKRKGFSMEENRKKVRVRKKELRKKFARDGKEKEEGVEFANVGSSLDTGSSDGVSGSKARGEKRGGGARELPRLHPRGDHPAGVPLTAVRPSHPSGPFPSPSRAEPVSLLFKFNTPASWA
ncbi:hypothetical protein KQX54_007375 [Cotesia glomerata]|uniref:Uncharacterized protein n=1 Tax=Cotesia glomerata TaxID=32391 RepID=A0AAV7IY92_COTGL|nr:hypothetical protein KQX54_007375 [Cotesia glomerata]